MDIYEVTKGYGERFTRIALSLQAAQERLYFVGIDSFNFDQDITSRLNSTPLALESMKGLLSPFLSLEQVELWSPVTLFARQQVRGNREESDPRCSLMSISKNEFGTFSLIIVIVVAMNQMSKKRTITKSKYIHRSY